MRRETAPNPPQDYREVSHDTSGHVWRPQWHAQMSVTGRTLAIALEAL
jgi:hypothetical protein